MRPIGATMMYWMQVWHGLWIWGKGDIPLIEVSSHP